MFISLTYLKNELTRDKKKFHFFFNARRAVILNVCAAEAKQEQSKVMKTLSFTVNVPHAFRFVPEFSAFAAFLAYLPPCEAHTHLQTHPIQPPKMLTCVLRSHARYGLLEVFSRSVQISSQLHFSAHSLLLCKNCFSFSFT